MTETLKTIFFAFFITIFLILLIVYPEDSLEASIRGLNIWWEVVFPSLLPFFIIAELFIGFGIVAFLGTIFEPVMRPLFNVPGEGSFAWMMGMASGYPTGAKIVTRLRENNDITNVEAERLLTFTNASSPLFMFGAIAVGFFQDASLGLLIAFTHYLGNFCVGLCMRFYRRSKVKSYNKKRIKSSFKKAFKKMHQSRLKDARPLGEKLGDSVLNSIKTLIIVGGFIVLFSVITALLSKVGFISLLSRYFESIFMKMGIPIELFIPFISGIFEISLGVQLISHLEYDTLLFQAVLVSFILGFNGFSIQAQISSIIAKTDIRFMPYFIARVIHGIFSSVFTILLYDSLYLKRKAKEVIKQFHPDFIKNNFWNELLILFKTIGPSITISFLCLGILIILMRKFIF